MTNIDQIEANPAAALARLRNQPVQARSTARVEKLLDATAAIVDEIGYERLTTAMVAERAGASIGTLYRYYPDRLAVLNGLRSRLVQRLQERYAAALEADPTGSLEDWLHTVLNIYVEMYRTEPGFRAIRFGDPIDDERQGFAGKSNGVIAAFLAERAVSRFNLTNDPEDLAYRFEVLVEIAESLVHRAYSAGTDQPDERFIAEVRSIAAWYLETYIR